MLAAGTAALIAGCSDASRFSADPFANPFKTASNSVDRAPTGAISRPKPLSPAPVQARPLPPPAAAPVASASPAPAPIPAATAQTAKAGSYNHWSAEHGTPITVGPGDTVAVLANRYGVPADALLKVNGFSNAAQIQPGARLVIPVYHAAGPAGVAAPPAPQAVARAEEKPAAKPAPEKPAPEKVGAKKPDMKWSAGKDGEEREAAHPGKPGHKTAETAPAEPRKLAKAEPAKGEAAVQSEKKLPPHKTTEDAKAKAGKVKTAKVEDAEDAAKNVKSKAKGTKPAAKAEVDDVQPAKPAQKAKLAKAEPVRLAKAEAAEPKKTAKVEEPKKLAAKEQKAAKEPREEKKLAAKEEKSAKVREANAAPSVKPEEHAAAAAPEKPARVAKSEPKLEAKPEPKVSEAPSKTEKAAAAPAQDEKSTTTEVASVKEFRWPARGRVIQGFAKGSNDGINIAVPEGTQVKAAEGGVVAYAGNELKGYGNLVLIRHPNGFVSAYAHNGEIEVKRGDQVKRGQTIAKSGQSGNVSSPQLHFELRKGAEPVDPSSYLAEL